MLIFENQDKAIYNFNLSTIEEANILSQFIDNENDLLFPYFEYNLSVFPETREYIEERTIIRSNEDVFNINNSELIYWYKPSDKDDLITIINSDRITYRCIVVPKNGNLGNCRFKLFVYEHAIYKNEETRVLWIDETIENDYVNNIYPKIIGQLK